MKNYWRQALVGEISVGNVLRKWFDCIAFHSFSFCDFFMNF